MVPSALDHVTLGSGSPDTQQLKRTVCPTTQRFGRSRALNCGADVINSRRRRRDAIEVLVWTDSESSASDARSKLEAADTSDSQSAPVTMQCQPLFTVAGIMVVMLSGTESSKRRPKSILMCPPVSVVLIQVRVIVRNRFLLINCLLIFPRRRGECSCSLSGWPAVGIVHPLCDWSVGGRYIRTALHLRGSVIIGSLFLSLLFLSLLLLARLVFLVLILRHTDGMVITCFILRSVLVFRLFSVHTLSALLNPDHKR